MYLELMHAYPKYWLASQSSNMPTQVCDCVPTQRHMCFVMMTRLSGFGNNAFCDKCFIQGDIDAINLLIMESYECI